MNKYLQEEIIYKNNHHNLNDKYERIHISLSSDFRNKLFIGTKETTSTTNFYIELNETINNIVSMQVLSSEIPFSDYNFSANKFNNKFKISINDISNNITEEIIIEIPDGIWNANDLVSYINNNYFGKLIVDNGNNLNEYARFLIMDYNINSGKISFRYKTTEELNNYIDTYGVGTIDINFDLSKLTYQLSNVYSEYNNVYNFQNSSLGTLGYDFNDIYNNLELILIQQNNTKSYGLITYNGVIEASNIYNVNNNSFFYIAIDDFQQHQSNSFLAIKSNSFISENIISKIQLSSSVFDKNNNNDKINNTYIRYYHTPVRLFKLHIKILNKFGEIVDLKNLPTSFLLEIIQKKT